MGITRLYNSSNFYPFDFKNHTILIAEDVDFSFIYMEAALRRTGIKILWSKNGKEAVESVKANPDIDLVLMDMYMPVMTGYEATEIIKKLRPNLTVIAQTAYCLPEDVKKCYAAGCTGFLAKPIRNELLIDTLAEYFERMEEGKVNLPLNKVSNG